MQIMKNFSALMVLTVLLTPAIASADACGVGTAGTIGSIQMQPDNLHFTVSFGNSGQVSVWHNLTENEGRGMLSFLLAGFAAGAKLTVTSCTNGQIQGARLTSSYITSDKNRQSLAPGAK